MRCSSIQIVQGITCVFMYIRGGKIVMSENQFQRIVFAFLAVLVMVHAYVFYSLYVWA